MVADAAPYRIVADISPALLALIDKRRERLAKAEDRFVARTEIVRRSLRHFLQAEIAEPVAEVCNGLHGAAVREPQE
jgi:hypothetical protein